MDDYKVERVIQLWYYIGQRQRGLQFVEDYDNDEDGEDVLLNFMLVYDF